MHDSSKFFRVLEALFPEGYWRKVDPSFSENIKYWISQITLQLQKLSVDSTISVFAIKS